MAKITLRVDTNIGQSTKQIEALKGSFQNVAQSISGIKVNKDLTAQINALTKHYKALADAAAKVIKVNNKNLIEEQKLIKAKAQAGKATADEITAIEKSKTAHVKHGTAVDDSRRKQEKHEAQMKKSTAQTNKSTDANKKHTQSIASMIPNILKWQVAMTAVMLPLRKLQEALDSVNETLVETEKRVVSLRRVAGDAANANELYDLAQKYGQTFENVADVVENLVKSGYTWEESLKAAEPALLAINVAELDAAQATEGLIAVVKQYGLELEDLNYIQGVLNKTADNAAVTTEKLLIALQKTGSTAKNANINFEETVGLITALSEGTAASGQNIGNALRSLIVFTSDSKALDTFAGLSSGMAETVKKFRSGRASILEVWEGLGAELAGMGSQKGTLEDLFGGAELSADIEAQLTQITDSFAEIYGTAGNYRQNYFIALLENIEKVKDVTGELGDVTTYSQKENEKYLNTYEAKVNNLTAKWQELANDEQGFLAFKKGMIELGTLGLEGVEIIGGFEGAFETLIAVSSPFFISWGITFGSKALATAKSGVVSLFTAIKAGTLSAKASLGITGALIAGIVTIINSIEESKVREFEKITNSLSQLTQKQTEYRNYTSELQEIEKVLKDSTSSEEQRALAQKQLFEIQNNLITSNGLYADSIDVINGKLDDELEKINKLKYEIERQAVSDFYQSNTDSYSNLNSYFNDKEKTIEFSDLSNMWENTFTNEFSTWLISNGYSPISVTEDGGGVFGDLWSNLSGAFGAKTWKTAIEFKHGATVEERLKVLKEMRDKANATGASEQIQGIIQEQINQIEKSEEYQNAISLRDGMKNAETFVQSLTADQVRRISSGEMSDEEFNSLVDQYYAIEEATEETSSNVEKFSDKLKTLDKETLTSIVDKLKAARDATKESYEYEEKKKAVLDAEERLRQAKENLTVVQFDENGNWTRVANQKEILEAEEDLEQARMDVEKEAYDDIIAKLQSGNTTTTGILMVIKQWASAYGSGDFSHFEETVDSILREYGIVINKTKSTTKGGLPAGGVGAYLYGTSDPIVQKMLSGTNDNTEEVARQNGLLFGSSRQVATVNPNSVTYHNQSVSNDRHDTQYHVNGVPIGADAASRYTIKELFQVMDLV